MTEDDESYMNDGGHPSWGSNTRQRNVPEGERMYAITESELKKYEGLFFLDDGATSDFKKIRSRPLSDMCMERNRAQGQPQARIAELESLKEWIRSQAKKDPIFHYTGLIAEIEMRERQVQQP